MAKFVNHIYCIVISHSLLLEDEQYKFSFACFEDMTEKQIDEIPDITIVSIHTTFEGFPIFKKHATYWNYFLNDDDYVRVEESGTEPYVYTILTGKKLYMTPYNHLLWIERSQLKMELLCCGIKPAKR